MSLILVQLSDVHVKSNDDPIFAKASKLAEAVVAEIDSNVTDCLLVLSGDMAFSGSAPQFDAARQLLKSVASLIENRRPDVVLRTLAVPGNHDCDFSSDQTARDLVLERIDGTALPAQSIQEIALSPLSAYFEFSASLCGNHLGVSRDCPFHRMVDVQTCDGLRIRFHLLNSAWMSSRKEKPGSLAFPVEAISLPDAPTAAYSVAVIHHPFNTTALTCVFVASGQAG